MYKSNIGDYPLKASPCRYWWVRYAVACTYFSEQQDKLVEAYRVAANIPPLSAYSGGHENRKIWSGGSSDEFLLNPESDDYKKLKKLIRKYLDHGEGGENIEWLDCPFQELDQSKCPFYEPSVFYKDKALEELREHKGYDIYDT